MRRILLRRLIESQPFIFEIVINIEQINLFRNFSQFWLGAPKKESTVLLSRFLPWLTTKHFLGILQRIAKNIVNSSRFTRKRAPRAKLKSKNEVRWRIVFSVHMNNQSSLEDFAQFLLDNNLILSALELFQETLERGKKIQLLHNYFCNDQFKQKLSTIEKTANKRITKSAPTTINSEQEYQKRIKTLEYDLRQERSSLQSLRKELETSLLCKSTEDEISLFSSLPNTNFEDITLYFHVHKFLISRGLRTTDASLQQEVFFIFYLSLLFLYSISHSSLFLFFRILFTLVLICFSKDDKFTHFLTHLFFLFFFDLISFSLGQLFLWIIGEKKWMKDME